jgi:hypothetical protein
MTQFLRKTVVISSRQAFVRKKEGRIVPGPPDSLFGCHLRET